MNDPLDEMYEEPSRDWIFPAGADRGFFMMGVGFGTALYGISTIGASTLLGPLTLPVTAALVAGGMVMTDRGYRAWRHGSRATGSGVPEDMFGDMDMGMDMYGAPQVLYVGGRLHPDVQRVKEVVDATWGDVLYPVWDKFDLKDGVLVAYTFKATTPGFFTDDGMKTKVVNKLVHAVEATQGSWNAEFDVKDDTITVSQKSSFKKIELPPQWPVVASEQQARDNYPSFEYTIGVDKDGGKIKFAPGNGFPHAGIFGTTGGGKSVMTRGVLEQFRAAGFQLFLCDGKGTDYTSMMTQPGVVAVASTLQEQIAVVHMVRSIMNKRRLEGSKKAKAGDSTWREQQTPLLLVLDEFATTSNDIQTVYPKSYKAFMNDIAAILKVGREMRCHIFICTQDMRASTVPGDWLNNMAVSICMGKPDSMTISKGFPAAVHGEAKLKGDTISKKTRGRGIVAITTEKGVTCELFQSYYSYSPAENIETQSADVKSSWLEFKRAVTERIPKLYSRLWFIPEYPEPEEGGKDTYADKRKKFEETNRVDMTSLDVLDIQKLKMVALEDRNGAIEKNKIYDPLHEDYLGGEVLEDGGSVELSL